MNQTFIHLPLPQFLARLSRPALFALLLVLLSGLPCWVIMRSG